MENQFERERSLPLFLLVSMAVHALLFLFGPHLVSGLFPSFQLGDQGGLTYVTLVDVPVTERARAPVPAAARLPQARPQPQALPQPPAPAPVRQEVAPVERTALPEPEAKPPVPQPQPEPAPVAVLQTPPRPVAEAPRPVPEPEPVLTSPTGETVVPAEPVQVAAESPSSDDVAAAVETAPATQVVEDVHEEPVGTNALEDLAAAAPDAEPAEEPRLPPAGESMVRDFGGSTFPKNAVGLVQGSVTVEVAAVVGADGQILEAIIVEGSGISVVDTHAQNVVLRLIPFRPYDDVYELRVFITFDSADQDRLIFRYGEFITSPPTLGRYAVDGGR